MARKRKQKKPVIVTIEQLPLAEQAQSQVRQDLIQTLADIIRELGVKT